MDNTVNLFKSLIRSEKIAKYNHNHDERGRFCSGDGSSADYSAIDKIPGLGKKDADHLKKVAENIVSRVINVDERLNIDPQGAADGVIHEISDYYKFGKNPTAAKCEKMLDDIEAETIEIASRKYCKSKLGDDVRFYAFNQDPTKALDFIDGAAWVKENIFFASQMKGVYGESENLSWFYQEIGSETIAATSFDSAGKCHMVMSDLHFSGSENTLEQTSFHPDGVSYTQIGAHEYTHAIELSLCQEVCDGDIDKADFLHSSGDVSAAVIKKGAQKCKRSEAELVAEVSEYATVNSKEAMAECVADYYSNRENAKDLSKAVVEILTTGKDELIQGVRDNMY